MQVEKTRATGSQRALLVAILAVALFLRVYGINWDDGYLFHPDERQILMVTDRLAFPWPPDIDLLLSEDSPWNPNFFAYGSMPLYLLRGLSSLAAGFQPELGEIEGSYWVGRLLSALFDVGTIWLVYWIGKRLHGVWTGLLSALLVTITVLHIQLSPFLRRRYGAGFFRRAGVGVVDPHSGRSQAAPRHWLGAGAGGGLGDQGERRAVVCRGVFRLDVCGRVGAAPPSR